MKHTSYLLSIVLIAALLAGCSPAATIETTPTPGALPTLEPPPTVVIRVTETRLLEDTPQPENTPEPQPNAGADPQVVALLGQVSEEQVEEYLLGLTGVELLTVGEPDVWIESRADEENLDEASEALYQFLAAQGLEVRYQDWYDDDNEISGRNVIGELRGTSRPEEIVLVCAHIDSYCEENLCPGADDNASGSVGVMLAAQTLSQMKFERTVRFAFFSGEEIDLLGSWYYAEELSQQGENVVAVINLDMIGWDGDGDGTVLLYAPNADDRVVAEKFIQAVEDYNIEGLSPRITEGDEESSDSYSFWEAGYPGILAIEDEQDEENPYYHTADDTAETIDIAYMTRFIRAAIATAAELAGPVRSIVPVAP